MVLGNDRELAVRQAKQAAAARARSTPAQVTDELSKSSTSTTPTSEMTTPQRVIAPGDFRVRAQT